MHVLLSEAQTDEVISAVRCCNNLLLATSRACSALLSAGVAIGLVDALPELHNRLGDTATIECDLSALRILCQTNAKSVYDATGTIATLKMVAESPSHCLSESSSVDVAIVLSSIAALSDRAREEIGASGFIGRLLYVLILLSIAHSNSISFPLCSLAIQVAQRTTLHRQRVVDGRHRQPCQQRDMHVCPQRSGRC